MNDGSTLISEVTWYSGVPLDLKVQAVADDGNVVFINGNVVSLTSDVFKAIKPEMVGSLVMFDFNAESSAKLRSGRAVRSGNVP